MKKNILIFLIFLPFFSFAQNVYYGLVFSDSDSGLGDTVQVSLSFDLSNMHEPYSLLGSFTCELSWDETILDYKKDSGLLNAFTGFVNIDSSDFGRIRIAAANPMGEGSSFKVVDLYFTLKAENYLKMAPVVNFEAMAAAHTFKDLLPYIKKQKSIR